MTRLVWWLCCLTAFVRWHLHLVEYRVEAAGWQYEAVLLYCAFYPELGETKMEQLFPEVESR